MRIEIVPLIIGVLAALLAVGLLFDAWTPDDVLVSRERRRRPRAERSRGGEALLGVGVLAMAAAFLGRDRWDWSVVAVIVGLAALLVGAWLNRPYLRELVVNRGSLRRGLPARMARRDNVPPQPRPAGPGADGSPTPPRPDLSSDPTPHPPRNRIR